MNIQVLNFYLPQTSAYFIFPVVLGFLLLLFKIGAIIALFMFLTRKRYKIKKILLNLYFIITFFIQIDSIYVCYSLFNTGSNHFTVLSTISFCLVFGIIFLIYYTPALGLFLVDFLITNIIKSKGVNNNGN